MESKQEKIHKQIGKEVDAEFKKKIHDAIKMGLFNPKPLEMEDLLKLPFRFDETEGVGYNWMNTCILWLYLTGHAIFKKGEEEAL